MDTDSNKMISKSELLGELYKGIQRESKEAVSIETLKQLIEDYAKYLGATLKPDWAQTMDKIFAAMDVDSNGKITLEEL